MQTLGCLGGMGFQGQCQVLAAAGLAVMRPVTTIVSNSFFMHRLCTCKKPTCQWTITRIVVNQWDLYVLPSGQGKYQKQDLLPLILKYQ